MSGAYPAVAYVGELEHAEGCVGDLYPALDDVLCYLRWAYPAMIDNLDDRLKRQKSFVRRILQQYGWSQTQLLAVPRSELGELEAVLQLCYHILRDIEYVDGLR